MQSLPLERLSGLSDIVRWLDQTLENMLLVGLAGNVERITAGIWLPVEIGVTISLLLYGFLVAAQKIPTPFGQAIWNIFRIAVVVGMLDVGGYYQTHIMGAMLELPNGLAQIISGTSENPRDWLAEFHTLGVETATQVNDRAPSFFGDMVRSGLFAIVTLTILGMYTIVTIMGLLLMSVAKAGMAMMVMIGPIFIASLLWEQTREFFKFWLQQTAYFAIYALLFSVAFGIVMAMLGYIQAILSPLIGSEEINILQILSVLMLVFFVAMFLMKLPSTIAMAVTNGKSVEVPILGRI